jgi:hypothetical protein
MLGRVFNRLNICSFARFPGNQDDGACDALVFNMRNAYSIL